MELTTAKTVEVLFENALETYEHQTQLIDMCTLTSPDPGAMQNAGNFIWRVVQQHAPIIRGWDLTGDEQDIIQESYPAILEEPSNDLVKQRVDDMRDMQFWIDRGKESGKTQATDLNKRLATAMAIQAGMYYRSNATSGFDFISEAQALMNERQLYESSRNFLLNDRSTQKFGSDLAGRDTLKGRPEDTWSTGQIGSQVAQFDVFTGSFLPALVGGAATTMTVTGDQSFKPEAGSVDADTGDVVNIDYRKAVLPVSATAGLVVGQKVKFVNSGTDVVAVGLADKTVTEEAATFAIVGITAGVSITVYPKPIALDDAALSLTEAAYANIDTQILDGAVVERVNTDTVGKVNLFWDKSAVEIVGGKIPANLFSQFEGKKVVNQSLSNGLMMYMLYDGNIIDMTFRFRIFTWAGITIKDPSNVGVAIPY